MHWGFCDLFRVFENFATFFGCMVFYLDYVFGCPEIQSNKLVLSWYWFLFATNEELLNILIEVVSRLFI